MFLSFWLARRNPFARTLPSLRGSIAPPHTKRKKFSAEKHATTDVWKNSLPNRCNLLLARFFEQKKFREIASTTGQSEAACKVRLRRVMNKMATWLNARGCTLGVTALASILASEWSRASPPSLLAKTTGFLQTASASKPLIISQTLAAMKISKMTFAGIVLLIGAATTTFILRKENDATPQNSSQASIDSTHSSNTGRSTRPRKRTRSTESLLSNYPFAHKRLEKIYQKYPNLRLAKFIPTQTPPTWVASSATPRKRWVGSKTHRKISRRKRWPYYSFARNF